MRRTGLETDFSTLMRLADALEANPVCKKSLLLRQILENAKNCIAAGQPAEAERIFLQALRDAEQIDGAESPLAAMVLIELYDLYEKQKRFDEGRPIWARIRKIATAYVQRQ